MRGAKPKSDAIRRGQTDSYGKAVAPSGLGVAMPEDIARDPVQSEIWAWIAPPVNNFTEQDIPNLRLLCYWHAVAAQAEQTLSTGDGRVRIVTPVGTANVEGQDVPLVKKNPALAVLKEASSEIRALSDMLGLSPLARSRIGLMDATTVKTAADTAAMFRTIDAAYELEEYEVEALDAAD